MRAIQAENTEMVENSQCIKCRPRSIILRAIRYRAVLRAWAFRPKYAVIPVALKLWFPTLV